MAHADEPEPRPAALTAVIVLLWVQFGLYVCGGAFVVYGLVVFEMGPEDDNRPSSGEAFASVIAEGPVRALLATGLLLALAGAVLAVLVAMRIRWSGAAIIAVQAAMLALFVVGGVASADSSAAPRPDLLFGFALSLATVILTTRLGSRRWLRE